MPELPPAARTVPPVIDMVPSASSGWLSAVEADQTSTVPPEMVSVPLESNPSPALVNDREQTHVEVCDGPENLTGSWRL